MLEIKKRGAGGSPFEFHIETPDLELVAPGDAEIQPVTAVAQAGRAPLRENIEVRTRLVDSGSQIGCVIPQPRRADAHPAHQYVP